MCYNHLCIGGQKMNQIKELRDFTCKSFKNYSTTKDYFKLNNYIYGENGEGKSSLLKGIAIECDKMNVRYEYYDRDYVDDVLSFEEDSIKGVKLTLGKGNVTVEKEIKRLKNEIKNISSTNNISSLEISLRSEYEQSIELINSIFHTQKGDTKIKIKKLNSINEIDEFLISYKDEQKKYEGKFDEDLTSKEVNSITYENNLNELRNIEDFKLINANEIDFENMENIFNTKFESLNIDFNVLKWIEHGKQFHKSGDIVECKFCKNRFNATERIYEINKLISNKTNHLQNSLKDYSKQLSALEHEISSIIVDRKVLLDNFDFNDTYSNALKKDKELLLNEISLLKENINIKISNMNEIVNFDFLELIDKISHFGTILEKLNKIKETLINNNDLAFRKINDVAKLKVAREMITNIELNKKLDSIKKDNDTLNEILNKISSLEQQIEALEQTQSNVSDVANFINLSLKNSGINIRLSIDNNDNYRLKLNSDPEVILKIKNISEGEKSLIAFLYWYFCLYKKLNTDGIGTFNQDIKIVIIDDPICSLDNKNNTHLITLINNIVKHSNFQTFIAFHEWRDFINLTYGKNDDIHKFIHVKKKNGISELIDCKNIGSFYKKMYTELESLYNKEEWTNDDVLKAPNYLRRCLETYLRFNYNIEYATAGTEDKIFGLLKVSNRKKDAFSTLLKICNIFSHGDAFLYEPSEEEIKNSVKCFMKIMESKDSDHHQIMAGYN